MICYFPDANLFRFKRRRDTKAKKFKNKQPLDNYLWERGKRNFRTRKNIFEKSRKIILNFKV